MIDFPDYPMTDAQRVEYERLRANTFAAEQRYCKAEADFAEALTQMREFAMREHEAATTEDAKTAFCEIENEAGKVSWALLHDEY